MAKKPKFVQPDEELLDQPILEIDKHRLDKEWLEQPILYHEYAQKTAEARRALDELELELEVEEASINEDIQKDPEGYGIKKITNDAIKACIAASPEIKLLKKKIIKAKFVVNTYAAAERAIDMRKRALENLVELHGRDYFSQPTAKSEYAKEKMSEVEKAAIRRRGRNND